MKTTPKRYFLIILPIILTNIVLSSSPCYGNIFDWIFGDDPLQEATKVIDESIRILEKESENWQKVLEDMVNKLTDAAQSAVRHEISNILNKAVATTGGEFRCNVDFVRTRIIQDLVRIKAKITNQPVPEKEPALCQIVPLAIDASLVPNRLKWLEFYGYDFDTTPIQVFLQNGKQFVDVSQYLQKPTHYHMTLNLGRNGVQLLSSSQQLTLRWNNKDISTITIAGEIVPNFIQSNTVGGHGGTPFVDPRTNKKLTGIKIRSGSFIDSIQIELDNEVQMQHGGNGGSMTFYKFDSDEYVTSISGRSGSFIDALTIHTNKRIFPTLGGSGGFTFRLDSPSGYEIIGFIGRSGTFIDSIGIISRQRNE